jgi:hypothetical protein
MFGMSQSETIAEYPNIRNDLSAHMQADYLIDCHWDAQSASLFLASGDTQCVMFSKLCLCCIRT